jgi:hypothetical protein
MSRLSLDQYLETCKNPELASGATKLSRDLSKVVAKSWLPEGEDIRVELLSQDQDRIKKIFIDNGCDLSFFSDHFFQLDFAAVQGSIVTDAKPPTIYCAYCPKPTDFNVTDDEIRKWVNEPDPNKIAPDNPYIPVTF